MGLTHSVHAYFQIPSCRDPRDDVLLHVVLVDAFGHHDDSSGIRAVLAASPRAVVHWVAPGDVVLRDFRVGHIERLPRGQAGKEKPWGATAGDAVVASISGGFVERK